VRIEVSDTGVGIPADQFERIFEPFLQVARSLTNVTHEGVGLGLSISRDLARAMGGDISVRSVVGQGSVFAVTLPRDLG
jgi:signal transduction histidine kinase